MTTLSMAFSQIKSIYLWGSLHHWDPHLCFAKPFSKQKRLVTRSQQACKQTKVSGIYLWYLRTYLKYVTLYYNGSDILGRGSPWLRGSAVDWRSKVLGSIPGQRRTTILNWRNTINLITSFTGDLVICITMLAARFPSCCQKRFSSHRQERTYGVEQGILTEGRLSNTLAYLVLLSLSSWVLLFEISFWSRINIRAYKQVQ